jgi:hypothetical protein
VKEKGQNINVRLLFRQKLENAELTPDVSVNAKLMRKVARMEFMRFNPSKFNIYYLSGILVTGITVAALVLFQPSVLKQHISAVDNNKSDSSLPKSVLEVNAGQPVNGVPSIREEKVEPVTVKQNLALPASRKPSNQKKSVAQDTQKTYTGNISSSLSENGLASAGATGKNKLQSSNNASAYFIDPYTAEGCAPFRVKFHNMSSSCDSCRWTFGDGGYSNEKDPEWIFDVEGEYKIGLQVFSRDGRVFTSSASVTVHPRPKAHFEIYPEKAVIPHDEIHFLNYSTNAVQSKWDFGDGATSDFFEPSHTYTVFSSYDVRLVVTSDWGCSDSLIIYNAFSGSQYFIDFPNAFIPNAQGPTGGFYSSKSDEGAQVFHPSFSGVTDYQLKIFSKLGIPIFESGDINIGWDGYNKGQLCEPGVYIWKVRGKFRNGEPFTKMGDVILLKN